MWILQGHYVQALNSWGIVGSFKVEYSFGGTSYWVPYNDPRANNSNGEFTVTPLNGIVLNSRSEIVVNVCQKFFYHFTPKLKKHNEKWLGEVVRHIGRRAIIIHPSKLWKAKFFILCDVIFLGSKRVVWCFLTVPFYYPFESAGVQGQHESNHTHEERFRDTNNSQCDPYKAPYLRQLPHYWSHVSAGRSVWLPLHHRYVRARNVINTQSFGNSWKMLALRTWKSHVHCIHGN